MLVIGGLMVIGGIYGAIKLDNVMGLICLVVAAVGAVILGIGWSR